jgi:hypothetical protein
LDFNKSKVILSLPQLQYILSKNNNWIDIRGHIEDRLKKWRYGTILRPEEADPQQVDFIRFINNKNIKLIENARYPVLLWKMRNFAVHEFRRAGQGFPFSNDNSTPYYHGIVGSPGSWELVIHTEVISILAHNCSENLKMEFIRERRNPYDSYNCGSAWA